MRPLRLGSPSRAVVVAPHPDDEVIGTFGLIRHLRRRGCCVEVVVVADGAASHRNSWTWPAPRLIAARRRETIRAMRALGVVSSALTFLNLPDGALGSDPSHGAKIARAARRTARAGLLVAPDEGDAHPDHKFVARALARTHLPGVRRLGYRVWSPGRRRGSAWWLKLGTDRILKRAAISRYRTQMGLITDDPDGFAIARHELRAFSRPSEFYLEERRCGLSR